METYKLELNPSGTLYTTFLLQGRKHGDFSLLQKRLGFGVQRLKDLLGDPNAVFSAGRSEIDRCGKGGRRYIFR